jgi:hypothetical protein
MRKLLTRWFGASGGDADWSEAADWARAAGHRFARSRDGSGFVIEPIQAGAAWRLEWGAPQRHYFMGRELRLRGEVASAGELQLMVMSRALMTLLEEQVFEEYTEGTETRMDDDTPEEMRWLVLYPKMPRAMLGALRVRFGVVANLPRAAPAWLEGALAQQLEASSSWLAEDQPLVIVVHRGRLTLRCLQPQADVQSMQAALRLFGAALAAAQRVGDEVASGRIGSDRPSTWGAASAMPDTDPTQR